MSMRTWKFLINGLELAAGRIESQDVGSVRCQPATLADGRGGARLGGSDLGPTQAAVFGVARSKPEPLRLTPDPAGVSSRANQSGGR